MKRLSVKKGETCMACLECVRACSVAFYKEFDPDKSCIQIIDRNGAAKPMTCVQCGKCATVCEHGAITQNAKLYRDQIAFAVVDHTVGRVTAAQAADELLNIIGIDTSFVLYPDGDRIIVSARSIGDTNVQVILEKLGGGGNAAAAGGQIQGKTLDQVAQELAQAIDQYLEE